MREEKLKRLQKNGWKVGSTSDFLHLSPEDAEYIELKLQLASCIKSSRIKKNLSQTEFAKTVKSSQSRVAKMESADPSVSVDLLVRGLLALGVSRQQLGKILTQSHA